MGCHTYQCQNKADQELIRDTPYNILGLSTKLALSLKNLVGLDCNTNYSSVQAVDSKALATQLRDKLDRDNPDYHKQFIDFQPRLYNKPKPDEKSIYDNQSFINKYFSFT